MFLNISHLSNCAFSIVPQYFRALHHSFFESAFFCTISKLRYINVLPRKFSSKWTARLSQKNNSLEKKPVFTFCKRILQTWFLSSAFSTSIDLLFYQYSVLTVALPSLVCFTLFLFVMSGQPLCLCPFVHCTINLRTWLISIQIQIIGKRQ